MVLQVSLNKREIRDVEAVRDMDAAVLRKMASAIVRLDPPPLKLDSLLEVVRNAEGASIELTDAVIRLTLSLYRRVRQAGCDVAEVMGGVHAAIQRDLNWSGELLTRWRNAESCIQELLNAPAIRLVSLSIDLSYAHANLLRSSRILTDIRPVYNAEATAIEAAVVSHTLRLRYDSLDGLHEISIAIDECDVRNLAKQCERATVKSRTARQLMSDKAEVPTIISGGTDGA